MMAVPCKKKGQIPQKACEKYCVVLNKGAVLVLTLTLNVNEKDATKLAETVELTQSAEIEVIWRFLLGHTV